MSANLPSRGDRTQGPGGREVQHADRPGGEAAEAAVPPGRSRQGRSREGRTREGRSREGHPPQRRQPGAMDTSAMDTGTPVRDRQIGRDGTRQAPDDADRRRLRTRRALRSPRAVRQAILLRELLGPPVALRRHREDPPSLSD